EPQLRRDEEFWFEDGSIVLAARDVEFRVYKRVLADHSIVFADMFTFPQPASQATAVSESCPNVCLDDSPEDLRHVLRALFPRKGATFIPLELQEPTFDLISAYARLGHKYQIDDLLDQSLAWLKKQFTSNFDGWCEQPTFPFDNQSHYAIGIVNFARLTQCHSILPTAMMVSCYNGGEPLVRGFRRQDGTQERLSEDDLILCIEGKNALTQATATCVLSAFTPWDDRLHPSCTRGMHHLLHLYRTDPELVAGVHPFSPPDCYLHSAFLEDVSICSQCLTHLRRRLRTEQVKLWNRLPDVLGL
ncbi:hypothetical protein OH76DRAFT_1313454, partial [Lentinus brumalis]